MRPWRRVDTHVKFAAEVAHEPAVAAAQQQHEAVPEPDEGSPMDVVASQMANAGALAAVLPDQMLAQVKQSMEEPKLPGADPEPIPHLPPTATGALQRAGRLFGFSADAWPAVVSS